jgi:flavin reductase (DIM6/NTAB) family NADH-FMN oxidoreductase RutF
VGKQDSASGLETRSSEAVQCFRFAGAPVTFECMVTIAVGVPFRDGL